MRVYAERTLCISIRMDLAIILLLQLGVVKHLRSTFLRVNNNNNNNMIINSFCERKKMLVFFIHTK